MGYIYNGWHVLRVKSLHERKINDLLLQTSIETFFPLIKILKKWSDRKKVISKPLFPSYIFVNIHSSVDFYKALDMYNAFGFIRFGKEYAKVTDKEINQIKLLIGDEDITDVEINTQLLNVGDIKKIAYGPLYGLECEIYKIGNAKKIIVQMNSLGQNITATIPSCYFEETTPTS